MRSGSVSELITDHSYINHEPEQHVQYNEQPVPKLNTPKRFRSPMAMSSIQVCILFTILMMTSPSYSAEKSPLPEEAILNKHLQLVRKLNATELRNARYAIQRKQLAEKLIGEAERTEDSASRYALLLTAQKLYLTGDDFIGAFQIVDLLQNDFQIDSLKTKTEILETAASQRLLNRQFKQVYFLIPPLIEEAIQNNNFETATALANLAKKIATKTRVHRYETAAHETRLELNDLQKQYSEFIQNQKSLQQAPQDQKLNLEIGRYLCFVKNEWPQGLQRLSQGGDEPLAALARSESEKGTAPLELGAAWWKTAEKLKGLSAKHVRQHAAVLYRKALPQLEGNQKTEVEQKLNELAPTESIKATLVAPRKYSRMIAQDQHRGSAGDRPEASTYFLNFPHPVSLNDLRLRIQGHAAQLNDTCNGAIFISIDGGEWLSVSGWTTESSRQALKFQGWVELEFTSPDDLLVRQLRVLFQYQSGKSAYVINQVMSVE